MENKAKSLDNQIKVSPPKNDIKLESLSDLTKILGESVNCLPSTLWSTILFPENLINFASKICPLELVHFLNSSSDMQIFISKKNKTTE